MSIDSSIGRNRRMPSFLKFSSLCFFYLFLFVNGKNLRDTVEIFLSQSAEGITEERIQNEENDLLKMDRKD